MTSIGGEHEIEAKLCRSRNNRRKGSKIRGRRVTFHQDAIEVIESDPEMTTLWNKVRGNVDEGS